MLRAPLDGTSRMTLCAALLAATAGCATAPGHPDDPFEGGNRAMYGLQTTVVDGVLDPVADGYRTVVPEAGREGLHNLLDNLDRPTSFLNHVLQADPVEAFTTAVAFALDTTVGLAGIWRPSARWGVVDEDTGFADTLTSWGFGRGVYVVLPLLGAGGTRSLAGRVVDSATDPTRWALGDAARLSLTGATILDVRERTLDRRRSIQETEPDPYAATRARFLEEDARDEDRARWIR